MIHLARELAVHCDEGVAVIAGITSCRGGELVKRILVLSLLVVFMGMAGAAAYADAPTITVIPSVAPNQTSGSPSWATYESNALYALENGLSSYGTPGTAGYYQAVANSGQVTLAQTLVTSFPSWDGIADPTGNYAGEYGSRLLFGAVVNGNGNTIELSNLSFNWTWDGQGGWYSGDYGEGYTYNAHTIGIIDNSDGSITVLNNGQSGTTPVNEIIATGTGGGIFAMYDDLYNTDGTMNTSSNDYQMLLADGITDSNGNVVGYTGTTLQDRYDSMLTLLAEPQYQNTPFDWGVTYSLNYTANGQDPTVTGAADLNVVAGADFGPLALPEPSCIALGFASLGLLLIRRRSN